MTWAAWHEKSERLASDAHLLARQGMSDQALPLFAEAAHAENQALNALDASKTRTLGITVVSAVSLWFKAKKFAIAERTAIQWLSSGKLPQFAVDQLRSMVQAIWTQEALQTAGVAFLPGQVLVSVKGGQTISGGAPLDLVVEKVQTVQALFFRTIEFLKGIPHRKRGAPSLEIQAACRPWLLQAPPGSYQFSVAVQEPPQPDFFKDAAPNAKDVANHFMSILKASSDDPINQLQEIVPSKEYRSTFLKLTRNLSPTGKNFSSVQIRTVDDVNKISLGPETRKEINRALRPPDKHQSPTEEHTELHGVLRALHLEKDWLELLLADGKSVHIDGLSEAVDDVIGPMVNRPVIVQAKYSTRTRRLHFLDIELDD